MAQVPFNPTGVGQSPVLQKPSEANLLMAASDMHNRGELGQGGLSSPQGQERPKLPSRKVRKLKVVK